MAERNKPQIPDEMPGEARRRDPGPDRPASLSEVPSDVAHAGISPALDGDNPEHPIHDEDIEDLGPEDFEEMIDKGEDRPVDKVIPK
jgi:hypothetical protein